MKHFIGGLLLWSAVPFGLALAKEGRIDERRAADPQGAVEISSVAGSIQIVGWDKPEIEVAGTYGNNVERVEVSTSGSRTSITVIPRSSGSDHGSAELKVSLPAKSSVAATVVGSDLKVNGVFGDVKLQSISGGLSGDVGGDLRASSVSGDVHMTANAAKVSEIKSISGDITFTGGNGEVEVATVSGTAQVTLGSIARGRFKSVSGDLNVGLSLSPGARIDGEAVSGNVKMQFATEPPDADVDVRTMSGDISNCFGPKPTESMHGSGARLVFKNGSGDTQLHVTTQSGNVMLCTKGGHRVS